MYQSAINFHIYSLIIIMIAITMFYLYTQYNRDFITYKRAIRIWTPIYILGLSGAIFTGVIMMASFKSGFSLANSVMILQAGLLIVLEIMRHRRLMRTTSEESSSYMRLAKTIYAIELLSLFFVSFIVKGHYI